MKRTRYRMFSAMLSLACLLALAGWVPAAAQSGCMDAVISNSSGSVIILRNGLSYTAYPGTAGRIAAWLPGDKVTLCRSSGSAYVMTNTSRGNGSVNVLRNY